MFVSDSRDWFHTKAMPGGGKGKDRCREQGCCCLRLEPRKSLGSDVLRSQGDFEFFISSNSVQSA